MPYKLNRRGQRVWPLAGVPWRDMSDAEFREAKQRHGAGIQRYFDHEPSPRKAETENAEDASPEKAEAPKAAEE